MLVFRDRLEENLLSIREQVLAGRPDVGRHRFFHVNDPKRRLICATPFPERVLHHAIMNVCEPALESVAIHDSYACRAGKGARKAVARAQHFARVHGWYLKLDIRKYFDSIDHGIALKLLERRFRERRALDLFACILATYRTQPGKGVPIGNLISQHLANYYLSGFDHWVQEERRAGGYVRYMDDFLVFAEGPDRLKDELASIRVFLRDRLGLMLKDDVQPNRTARGFPFLGYRVFPGRIPLAPGSRRRFADKLRDCEARLADGLWDEHKAARHAEPLVDFTRVAAAAGFRRSIMRRQGAAP